MVAILFRSHGIHQGQFGKIGKQQNLEIGEFGKRGVREEGKLGKRAICRKGKLEKGNWENINKLNCHA